MFSPAALCVNFEHEKYNKRLITLRDYDFVGEDKRLAAVLATRMAMLQAPLNLSDIESRWAARQLPLAPRPPGAARQQPPAPGPPEAQDLRHDHDDLRRDLGLPHSGNASEAGDGLLGPASGRRWWVKPWWIYPAKEDVNKKIMDMMRQSIYAAQRKMYEIHGTISKYERDARFRMAFIFRRLDEWKHDARTVVHAMLRYRWYRFRAIKHLWYYEHLLRINIDVTYSIEHLLHLHTKYMERMNEK